MIDDLNKLDSCKERLHSAKSYSTENARVFENVYREVCATAEKYKHLDGNMYGIFNGLYDDIDKNLPSIQEYTKKASNHEYNMGHEHLLIIIDLLKEEIKSND